MTTYSPHHVSITVANTAASVQFYGEFGFEVAFSYRSPSGDRILTHLRLGALLLEIFEFPNEAVADFSESNRDIHPIGLRHFALEVDDIENAYKDVCRQGHECQPPAIGQSGMGYIFVRDPDGIWFEVVEDKRLHS